VWSNYLPRRISPRLMVNKFFETAHNWKNPFFPRKIQTSSKP
jgi:hypothetical protein